MAKADLTADRLREVLTYDPETGVFRWKINKARVKAGDVAGNVHRTHGYLQLVVDGFHTYGHRAAWLYVHDHWPNGQIDHMNGDRADNSICNLRDVSRRVNLENQRSSKGDTVSGLLGVSRARRKNAVSWRARIKAQGATHYLGDFCSAEEAHAAYLEAKRRLHEGCTI